MPAVIEGVRESDTNNPPSGQRYRACRRLYRLDKCVDLRRHLAEIVELTEVGAGAADDVVCRRRVELHLQHREMVQVVLTLELARLATHRDRDDGIFLAVELISA